MNDFDFDCLQKKRLAQQAKYRKRGSKSKKCTMSTDYMTTKQWGGLSSEVQRFVKKEFKRRFPAQAFAGATI